MVAAAQKAGRKLIRDFGEVEQLQVSQKGPADFVSAADKRSEKILHEELSKARPNYNFLMEESGTIPGLDKSNCWIIDPLDGTTNFLHGISHFSISIGLERDNDIYAGVIHCPITDHTFWAEKGKGAFLNSQRLRVSGRKSMQESLFATGIPFNNSINYDGFQEELSIVMKHTAGVRRFGVASLDLAWVAAGRFDGFWETGLKPWDLAAGIILVREAGGFVSDISGGKVILKKGDIVATNHNLHADLISMLKNTKRFS